MSQYPADPPNPPAEPSTVNYQPLYGIQVDRDVEHLRILSICWYVAAALALLGGCIPTIHITLGIMMISHAGAFPAGKGGAPPPDFLGWIFVIMGFSFMALAWTGSVLSFITARSLPQRRRRVVCHVAAGLACLQIPIGLTLAIFTFIVLSRPSIRATFQ